MSRDPLIPIRPRGPLDATIAAPPSKSLTIRALAIAALAEGRSILHDPSESDDTRLMARALARLGIPVRADGHRVHVEGLGGRIPSTGTTLLLQNAGTPLRILTAICALARGGRFVLDGSARMRRRPVGPLVDALARLDVSIRCANDDGCPPVQMDARGIRGGYVLLDPRLSSQHLSALLIAGRCADDAITIELTGDPVSRPYVDLTLASMALFGAPVEHGEHGKVASAEPAGRPMYRVSPDGYRAAELRIEGDASSASYLWAAAAVAGGTVAVTGVPPDSRQGDLRVLDALGAMGCSVQLERDRIAVTGADSLAGLDIDLGDAPDIVPTLAAVALFAREPTTIRGIAHLRLKESDRIATTATAVETLGGRAETGTDRIVIHPPDDGAAGLRGGCIDPAADHRIAMAFAIPGLRIPGVTIAGPGCVGKSFPGFFDALERLGG